MFSLLISDKIKFTLPEACLDHVLTAEGDTWLECEALENTIDIYFTTEITTEIGMKIDKTCFMQTIITTEIDKGYFTMMISLMISVVDFPD